MEEQVGLMRGTSGGPNTAILHEKDNKYRNTAQKIAKYRKH